MHSNSHRQLLFFSNSLRRFLASFSRVILSSSKNFIADFQSFRSRSSESHFLCNRSLSCDWLSYFVCISASLCSFVCISETTPAKSFSKKHFSDLRLLIFFNKDVTLVLRSPMCPSSNLSCANCVSTQCNLDANSSICSSLRRFSCSFDFSWLVVDSFIMAICLSFSVTTLSKAIFVFSLSVFRSLIASDKRACSFSTFCPKRLTCSSLDIRIPSISASLSANLF